LGFLAEPLARIEPSTGAAAEVVLAALDRIAGIHLPELRGADRRHFKAGYRLQRAAALFRSDKTSAVRELVFSLAQSPFDHQALNALMHNRFAKAVPG
jgi:hypothetical protein